MRDSGNNHELGALVKARTVSLQKASSGLVRRAMQDIERLTTDARVAELVTLMCADGDWKQREGAWLKLRKMGPTYRGWAESLRNAIYNGDGWSRIFAAESLSRFKCNPDDAIPVLVATIEACAEKAHNEKTQHEWGRLGCGAIGNYDAIPDNHTHDLVQALVRVLNATGFSDFSSLPVDQYNFRGLALNLLSRCGRYAVAALPTLAPLLEYGGKPPVGDPMYDLYWETARSIHPGIHSPLDAFIYALQSEDSVARSAAVNGIQKMGEGGIPAIPHLLSLSADPSSDVRRFLAITLGKLRHGTDNVLRILKQLNHDCDASVTVGASYALARLGDDSVANVHRLLTSLFHEERFVRFLAAWAVGEVGICDKENVIQCLARALTREEHQGNRELMSQSLERIKKC